MAESKSKLNTLQILLTILLSARFICGAEIPPTTTEENIVGYEGTCNATWTCAPIKGLICSDGSCKCSHPKTIMTYEEETGRCVVLGTGFCLPEDSPFDSPARYSFDSTLPCPKTKECDPETRLCLPAQTLLNTNCSSSSDCLHDILGYICEKNVCTCDPNNEYATVRRCLGKVEKPCVYGRCAPKAICMDLPDTTDKACKCIEGYSPTPKGKCAKDYGIDCTQTPCKPWLKCGQNGSCECPDRETQVFDAFRESCVAKVYGECNSNVTDNDYEFDPIHQIPCVDGGHCVKNFYFVGGKRANTALSHCECKPGFVENDQGTCDLGYGKSCEDSDADDWTYHKNLKCTPKLKLACVKGKCVCQEPFHAYDEEEGRCVGLSGASCTTDADLWVGDFKTPYFHYNVTTGGGDGHGKDSSGGKHVRGGCTRGARCQPVGAGTRNSTVGTRAGICKCVGEKEFDGSCEGKPLLSMQWIYIIAAAGAGLVLGCILLSCYRHIKSQGRVVTSWLL